MSKPTTDDEVLALAEKIKQQRSANVEYARASDLLQQLGLDIDNQTKQIYEVEFRFIADSRRHYSNDSVHFSLCDSPEDLIQLLQNYIAEKTL